MGFDAKQLAANANLLVVEPTQLTFNFLNKKVADSCLVSKLINADLLSL